MSKRNRVIALAGLIATLAFVAVIHAQQPGTPPHIDAEVLKNAGTPADTLPGSWLSYGHSQSETRYSAAQTDRHLQRRAGSGSRGPTWSAPAAAIRKDTPLVWNNTLYGITNWSVVFALDARTGKELWRWDPEVNQAAVRPQDLLRHRQPRPRPLQRHDLRARHRRPPDRARRPHRQVRSGNRASPFRRTCTPSPWRRASPTAR